jgi:metabotropic glutamate receptor 2/3/metabotropic glutamate receptor 6/7/8
MMQLLPLALHLSMVCLVLAAGAGKFKFNVTTSEVVRDDEDGGRIRGVRSRENATFVLGGLFPIHTHSADPSQGSACGDIRQERGLERMEAMLFAIDTINADPDLLPGVDLGYDIRDTCNSETVGLDEAIDLIITGSNLNIESCEALPDASPAVNGTVPYAAVPTSGIVGAAGSGVSVPVASLGRLFRMPQVSYASTSPLLTDRSRYGYFRRTVPSDDLQALAMVDILQHFNWNYVSILHSEDTYGSAGINEFVNVSATNNICIDLRRGIPPTFSESEYDSLVEDLRLSRARVVIIFANQESVGEVLTRVNRDETMRRNFTWIASDAWARSIDLVHQFNDTAAGLFGVAPLTEHLPAFEEYISKLTINSNTRNNWFPEN